MRFLGYILLVLITLVSLPGVWLGVLAPYVNPSTVIYPALAGLVFPAFAGLALIAAMGWSMIKASVAKWVWILALPAALFLPRHFGFNYHKTASGSAEEFKVLTWNVRVFNKNIPDSTGRGSTFFRRDEMINLIVESDADLVCFQEFYAEGERRESDHLKRIQREAGLEHTHFHEFLRSGQHRWGLVIASRYPILETGVVPFSKSGKHNGCTWADIDMPSGRARVYNAHLQSVFLNDEDLSVLDPIARIGREETQERASSMVGKLKTAYGLRAVQGQEMSEAIEACEWPVIVTGDFNDTPQSFTYRNIRKGLNDAFGKAGRGFGRSHSHLPFLRIDYVLPSPDFDVNRYELIRNDASDHYPVLATLEKR